MNRRNLLAAALGLPLAPLAALTADAGFSAAGSLAFTPGFLDGGFTIHYEEARILSAAEWQTIASRVLFEAWARNGT
jgi:hypothetical protein